jgi:O-antigen/teichoic acid export membrane protein
MAALTEYLSKGTKNEGLGRIAMQGSLLNSAQWLFNKVLTAGAMLLIAYFLSPSEYGVGIQALAIYSFISIFQPMTVGDVLIAHPTRFSLLAPSASVLAMILGCFTALITLIGIPLVIYLYSDYPASWLIGLMAVQALRPIIEAKFVVPLSAMRLSLAYPKMAFIDGVVQMGATLLSVAMAALGGRATALVIPQIVNIAAKATWYSRIVAPQDSARFHPKLALYLFKSFIKAASAQYIHNIIWMLEIIVLGIVSGKYETGLFGLAYSIAAQANTVIAFQLGVVLQPIFGRLQDDPERQVVGFLKAQRVLSAVCVPICFTQAILAEPLFRLVLDAKWQPAIPVFQVVSLMQAFYFATGPSMSCLRAQRRFGTFFAWQGIQLLISLPIYWMGADWKGALGIALASGACWAISAPLVVWLCTLASPRKHLFDALAIFVRPWVVCVPLFGGFYTLIQWSSSFGRLGDIASLFIVGPIATLLAIWIMRFLHADIRNTIDGFVVGALAKVRRKRST